MFKEIERVQEIEEHDKIQPVNEFLEMPTAKELEARQSIIDNLVLKRYSEDDNGFLRITEMNYFEQFRIYTDTYPFLRFRMKLWYFYM
jgi:hypothetical protein